ncbi:MAG: hypothetical protein EB117_13720 [Betaproteobacteria bacterium]|nr:hypothetical protein [Betaproteobacteria bacterium]
MDLENVCLIVVPIKTTSESTNVLETFKRQWKLLKQPFPWKDPKVIAERRRIAALDRARIDLRLSGGVK